MRALPTGTNWKVVEKHAVPSEFTRDHVRRGACGRLGDIADLGTRKVLGIGPIPMLALGAE